MLSISLAKSSKISHTHASQYNIIRNGGNRTGLLCADSLVKRYLAQQTYSFDEFSLA